MAQAKIFHTSDLDNFISECDRRGTIGHPDGAAYAADFKLRFDAFIDQSLDPFSAEYSDQMIALFQEISGRALDQDKTEQYAIDIDKHVTATHPLADWDTALISIHVAAIARALDLAGLPPSPKILDLGCGWGQTSEIMAYCGAHVTAVDINDLFVQLVNRRAERLSLPIKATQSNFDDFTSDESFDLVFFYECLHHSIHPWVTLQNIAKFVKPGGKIAFAGEPIQSIWWKNWGLRLDGISIYCIRKFGWFENGWSGDFLAQCFKRAGFDLTLYPGEGLRGGEIGIATRRGDAVTLRAPAQGYPSNTDHLQAELERVKAKNKDLRAELKKKRAEVGKLKRTRDSLFQSMSWRITKPMRAFRRLFEKIF